jgi:hypothetical protein
MLLNATGNAGKRIGRAKALGIPKPMKAIRACRLISARSGRIGWAITLNGPGLVEIPNSRAENDRNTGKAITSSWDAGRYVSTGHHGSSGFTRAGNPSRER